MDGGDGGRDPGDGFNAALADHEGPTGPLTALGLIRWLLRRQLGRVLVGATAGVVWMGSIAALPVLLGGTIDHAVDGGSGADVARWCALLAAAVVVQALSGVLRHRCAVTLFIRTRWLAERLLTRRVLDPGGGVDVDAGTLLSHAQTDARALGAVADRMCRGTGAVVTFAAVGIGMLVASPVLGLLVLLGLPPTLLVLIPLWGPYDRRATEQQARMAEASSVAADALDGLRVVKGLGGEDTVRGWFASSTAGVQHAAVDLARLGAAWRAVSTVVPGLFLAVVLWVGGHQAVDGRIRPGELVTFTGLAVFLAIPLATFSELGDVWASGVSAARRIVAVLETPPALPDQHLDQRPETQRAAPVGVLAIRGVTDGPLVDLDLVAGPTGLVGIACASADSSGALADLLARRRDPASGTIGLGDVDATAVPPTTWRSWVTVEDGHDAWLADAPLGTNVALGRPAATDEDVLAALGVAAAEEVAATVEGLAVHPGESGRSLSGGQRQRVGVARSVAAEAPVLVLDDPTSALDSLTEHRLIQRLAAARAGRLTVIATISPTVLAACDRVVLLADGRVTADGTHQGLLADSPAYRDLVVPVEADGGATP